jgi:hypothetical protein
VSAEEILNLTEQTTRVESGILLLTGVVLNDILNLSQVEIVLTAHSLYIVEQSTGIKARMLLLIGMIHDQVFDPVYQKVRHLGPPC